MDPVQQLSVEVPSETIKTAGTTVAAEVVKKVLNWIPRKSKPEPKRDRRNNERRQNSLDLRMRTGVWLEFHRKTGLGKSELIHPFGMKQRDDLTAAAVIEANRYELSDRSTGSPVRASAAVGQVLEAACAEWRKVPGPARTASVLTDALARQLLHAFNVRQPDRRESERKEVAAS